MGSISDKLDYGHLGWEGRWEKQTLAVYPLIEGLDDEVLYETFNQLLKPC